MSKPALVAPEAHVEEGERKGESGVGVVTEIHSHSAAIIPKIFENKKHHQPACERVMEVRIGVPLRPWVCGVSGWKAE